MQLSLAGLTAFVATALAADITLYLPPKPNPFTLPASTHATLSTLNHRHATPLTSVNTFVFRNVTEDASYLLDVYCTTHAYTPLRIDVTANGEVTVWETYRGNDWGNKGEQYEVIEGSVGKGVLLRSIGGKNYFYERPKFSILTILKNPMILMGLVSMVMFIGMPKLVENMDPEMRADFEERQKQGPLAALMGDGARGGNQEPAPNPLGNFDMAAYLAGSKAPKDGGNGSSGNGQKEQGVRR